MSFTEDTSSMRCKVCGGMLQSALLSVSHGVVSVCRNVLTNEAARRFHQDARTGFVVCGAVYDGAGNKLAQGTHIAYKAEGKWTTAQVGQDI